MPKHLLQYIAGVPAVLLGSVLMLHGMFLDDQGRQVLRHYHDMRYDNPAGYPGVTLEQKEALKASAPDGGIYTSLGMLMTAVGVVLVVMGIESRPHAAGKDAHDPR